MPGWKSDVGRRLDAIIVRRAPDVRKAVRWNSPFYGMEGQGWFLNFHCFTKYVKVAFFNGTSLDPVPPGESKDENVRYLNIYEDGQFDEGQFAVWVKQASRLPGWGGVAGEITVRHSDKASRRPRDRVAEGRARSRVDVPALLVVPDQRVHELHRVVPDDLADRRSIRRGLLEQVRDILEHRSRAVAVHRARSTSGTARSHRPPRDSPGEAASRAPCTPATAACRRSPSR